MERQPLPIAHRPPCRTTTTSGCLAAPIDADAAVTHTAAARTRIVRLRVTVPIRRTPTNYHRRLDRRLRVVLDVAAYLLRALDRLEPCDEVQRHVDARGH